MCIRIPRDNPKRPVAHTRVAALLASAGLLVAPSAAFASNNPQNGAQPAQPNGPDLNGSGVVDFSDLMMLLSAMGSTPDTAWVAAADLNQDGIIDFGDLSILLAAFGQAIPPPPPTPEPPAPEEPTHPETPVPPEVPETPETPAGPVLYPGPGFTGPTVVPSVIGNPARPGANAKVIARWDVVPFQTFTDTFTVGVVAFHINGIDRVDFSANGGEWIQVNEMTLNPRTGVHEYWVTLDADDFRDGLVEVRAVVYPKMAGMPRVLAGEITGDAIRDGQHSMFLSANANGTLNAPVRYVSGEGSDQTGDGSRANPFRTPYFALQHIQRAAGNNVPNACDGAMIYCLPGEYTWGPAVNPYPKTMNRWATITPAPGVDRDEVVFNAYASGGFRTKLIAVDNVAGRGELLFRSAGAEKFLWANDVEMIGPGRTADRSPFAGHVWSGMYVTNSSIENIRDGIKHAALVRDSVVRNIASDAYTMSRLVVNCVADNINNTGTPFHADLYQFHGTGSVENHIVYGLRATNLISQGLFADDLERVDNVAFVNVLAERDHSINGTGGRLSQWVNVATNHLLLQGVSLPNYSWAWRTPYLENVSVRGCVFDKMVIGSNSQGQAAFVSDSWFKSNHFIDATSFGARVVGSDATTGDPKFVNPAADDYRPRAGSPLVNRVNTPVMRTDLLGKHRSEIAAVGALEANE